MLKPLHQCQEIQEYTPYGEINKEYRQKMKLQQMS